MFAMVEPKLKTKNFGFNLNLVNLNLVFSLIPAYEFVWISLSKLSSETIYPVTVFILINAPGMLQFESLKVIFRRQNLGKP